MPGKEAGEKKAAQRKKKTHQRRKDIGRSVAIDVDSAASDDARKLLHLLRPGMPFDRRHNLPVPLFPLILRDLGGTAGVENALTSIDKGVIAVEELSKVATGMVRGGSERFSRTDRRRPRERVMVRLTRSGFLVLLSLLEGKD